MSELSNILLYLIYFCMVLPFVSYDMYRERIYIMKCNLCDLLGVQAGLHLHLDGVEDCHRVFLLQHLVLNVSEQCQCIAE